MTRISRYVLVVSFMLASGSVLAQTGGPSAAETTPPQTTKQPEQQAIDACKGKSEGDRVRFTDSKGKKRYYACIMVDGVLAARSGVATPAHPPKKK